MDWCAAVGITYYWICRVGRNGNLNIPLSDIGVSSSAEQIRINKCRDVAEEMRRELDRWVSPALKCEKRFEPDSTELNDTWNCVTSENAMIA